MTTTGRSPVLVASQSASLRSPTMKLTPQQEEHEAFKQRCVLWNVVMNTAIVFRFP
jgi:hypothetical protein